ncbi:hypothetical protein IscW_ISCW008611 [Ixodes scapularis]|uniref:Uncharacterized protein n=1 Tax=Ixodes scapularis TaxID=6945 RepID=B7Q209_IXOSC|nr:hypothetical protein IscW_ISCW008611 [Ixodes scapularis]|eukprot:XP_002410329.1 hypothetical protein IscW_ISCW008611 [Ixodes scapularis]
MHNYEVERLAQLAAKEPKSRVCFTLTLGGNQFELEDATQHGLGAPAKHTKDVSFSEVNRRNHY